MSGIEKGRDQTGELTSSCTSESEGEGPRDSVDMWARSTSPCRGWMGPEGGLSSSRQDSSGASSLTREELSSL